MDPITEQARERLAQQRQHSDRRQDSLHERTEEELQHTTDSTTESQARSGMVEQRQGTNQREAAMLERSEEELQSS